MKKIMRRFLVCILVMSIALTNVMGEYAVMEVQAESIISGTINENITWQYSDNGTLTINGSGIMPDYETTSDYYNGVTTNVPWKDYLNDITKVVISGNINNIGKCAFSDCSLISEISFSSSIREIGESAFARCTGLSSISLPNELVSIGKDAFRGCTGITSIAIPDSVTTMGSGAFQACKNLKTISLSKNISSINANTFSSCIKLSSVEIPENIVSIGTYAFSLCSSIIEMDIPISIISMGDEVFMGCSSLKKVKVNNDSISYGQGVFRNCSSDFVLYGNSNSTSEAYAEENGYAFVSMDAEESALQIKSFVIDKKSGQKIGTKIALSAWAYGGTAPYKYAFYYKKDVGLEKNIQSYSSVANVDFILSESGEYTFGVRVKDCDGVIIEQEISNYQVIGFTGFAGGDGTINKPYQISSVEMFREMENYSDTYFILINDLNLSNIPRISSFKSVFDGNGHTIITSCNSTNGLFSEIEENAEVNNLIVDIGNNSMPTSQEYGAIAIRNRGKIENCQVKGSIYNTTNLATDLQLFGGIAAYNSDPGIITKCRDSISVNLNNIVTSSAFWWGGIAGNSNSGKITKCLIEKDFNITVKPKNSGYSTKIGSVAGVFGYHNISECGVNTNINIKHLSSTSNYLLGYGVFAGDEWYTYDHGLTLAKELDGISSCYIPEDFSLSVDYEYYGSGGGFNIKSEIYTKDDIKNVKTMSSDKITQWYESLIDDEESVEHKPLEITSFTASGNTVGEDVRLSATVNGGSGSHSTTFSYVLNGEEIILSKDTLLTCDSFKPAEAGSYDFIVTVTDSNGEIVIKKIEGYVISEDDADIYEDAVDDILTYEQYQAKYYSNNASFISDAYMTYSEIEDNYTPTQYALNNILSFGWNKKFGFSDDAQVWEVVILDILFQNGASETLVEDWEKDSIQFSADLCVFIENNNLSDLDANLTFDVNDNLTKLMQNVAKSNELTDMEEFVTVLNNLADATVTVKDYVDACAKYIQLRKVVDIDMKAFLHQMQDTDTYRNIPAFQRALDRVIANLEVDSSKLTELILTETTSDSIIQKGINFVVGATAKVLLGDRVFQLIDVTKNTTIYLINTLCGTEELAQANVYLYIVDCLDNAASEAFTNASKTCLDSDGKLDFHAVNGGLEFFIALYTYGISVCRNWNEVIATDILTWIENGTYVNVKRLRYDMANAYLNLNHSSSKQEKKEFIEKRCREDEEYIDVVLENQPAFARIQWYYDSGLDKNETDCLAIFKVQNPNGRFSCYAQVIPKNTTIQYPELGLKSGYKTPTTWYIDSEYEQEVDENFRIEKNTVFYTRYRPSIFYEQAGTSGIKIISINGVGNQIANTKAFSIKSDDTYEIPSYIDGYKVVALGEDIFSECPYVTSVFIPSTIIEINDTSFKSLSEKTEFKYVEGSAAETFIKNNKYPNTVSEQELVLKENVINMKVGDKKQLEIEQSGSSVSDTIHWLSSDSNIVKVENGILTALKQGQVTITASTESVSVMCIVNVTDNNINQSGGTDNNINSGGTDNKLEYSNAISGDKTTATVNTNVGKPGKTTIKKIKGSKKSLKISWKKVKGVSGYQIQYSTSSKFKKAKKITIKTARVSSKTIKKLKQKKKYYVRVRSYITVNGITKYSNWSKKRSQRTK